MQLDLSRFSPAERSTLQLRVLYEGAGYRKFRCSHFEEYSLYQQNERFLSDSQVITFTDLDGKLRAIKPDVTLSIAKNAQPAAGECKKYYYTEQICRPSRESHTFSEISQMGLECIGAVGAAEQAEVVRLALESLASLEVPTVLEVSHMGFVTALLDTLHVDAAARPRLLELLRDKNAHELHAAALQSGLDEAAANGVILLRMQHVVFGVQQIRHQRVAVRKIMDDRVMAYVVDANRHLAVAERTFTARMRVIHKLLEQAGGTTFRGRAEQARDDGGVGPVARTRGAEGAVQTHPETHGAHQQITRQRGAGFREMVPCLHGADGVGTGRSGPHFEQVEQRGIDVSLRHGDLLNPGLRALVLEAFAARNGRPETRPEKPLIFSDQKKLKTRRVVLEP